ncbi:MAG: hypothetical protein AAF993_14890 [Pseudomonadota bacterium]
MAATGHLASSEAHLFASTSRLGAWLMSMSRTAGKRAHELTRTLATQPSVPPINRHLLKDQINQNRLADRYLQLRLRLSGRESASRLFEYNLHDEFLSARAERKPTLLLFWHAGLMRGVFPALSVFEPDIRLIKSERAFKTESAGAPAFLTDQAESATALNNAKLLKSAIGHMREGNIVANYLDGTSGGSTVEVSFMGTNIALRRGSAMLATRAKARVFPALTRWSTSQRRLQLLVGAQLDEPDADFAAESNSQAAEQALTQSYVRWFEQHLTTHPADIISATTYLISNPQQI